MAVIGPDRAAQMWREIVATRDAAIKLNASKEFQAKDGFGGDGLTITEDEWAAAQLLYGPRCWQDPEFRKAWARDNPESVWRAKRGTRGQEYAGTRYLTKDPLPKGTLFVPPHIAAEVANG